MEHDCKIDKNEEFADSGRDGYGIAIELPAYYKDILIKNGWYIGNDEYYSKIRYCPYCGLDLYSIENPQI